MKIFIEKILPLATVLLSLISIIITFKIGRDQIRFSKEVNRQEIDFGRPFISSEGNVQLMSNDNIINVNIHLTNIGRRPLEGLQMFYFVVDGIEHRLIESKSFETSNVFPPNTNSIFYGRIPYDQKDLYPVYHGITLTYVDTFDSTIYRQSYFYFLTVEEQKLLLQNISRGLFSAQKDQVDRLKAALKNTPHYYRIFEN